MARAAAKRNFAAVRTCRALVSFALQLPPSPRFGRGFACLQRWSLRVRIRCSARRWGLKDASLDDAGILENYHRDSYEDLLTAGVTGASTAVDDIPAAGIAGGVVTPADMDVDGGTTMVHILVWLCHTRHHRFSFRLFYCLFLPMFSPSPIFRPPSFLAPPSTIPLICLCHDAHSARLRVNTIHPAPEIHEHFMIHKGYGTLCTTSSTLSPTLRPL